MQAIPAIMENKIAPPVASPHNAPRKKPAIPAAAITIPETTVRNFFMLRTPFQPENYRFRISPMVPITSPSEKAIQNSPPSCW